MTRRTRSLAVDLLARVEGEGSLRLDVVGDEVTGVELRIMEPPRFFEAMLRGRSFTEAPDLTARICGICPVAYQTSACWAMEQVGGVVVPPVLRAARRLLFCGEWVESHALHVYLLHGPDFLGYEGVVDLARDHPDLVRRGLRLKKAGNALMTLLGGRSVHPVTVRVGGFHRLPSPPALRAARPMLEQALDDAVATVHFVAGLTFPDAEQPHPYLALRAATAEQGYPIEGFPAGQGSVVTTTGLEFGVEDYLTHVVEEQVERSHALHARLDGRTPFVTGPLARFALNADRLTPLAAELAAQVGLVAPCRNPFRSIVVRSLEIVVALEEALRLLDVVADGVTRPTLGVPAAGGPPVGGPAVDVPARAGVGHGVSEAPRGVLYHRYTVDAEGMIADAVIVPPTSQNQLAVEADLRAVAQAHLHLSDDDLRRLCEQTVRNYDPCISCATHALDLTVVRRPRPS